MTNFRTKLYRYDIVICWLISHNLTEKQFSEKYDIKFPIVSMMMDQDPEIKVSDILKVSSIIGIQLKDLFYDV